VAALPIHRNRFLVLGRAGMDFYADPPGARTEDAHQFFAALGGSAANIAVAIVKLGGAASLVTVLSDDAVGCFVLNELRRYGVAVDHVRAVGGEARTSLAVVESRWENCQSVIYRNDAADFQLAEDDMRAIPFGDFGALIVTGTSLAVEPSRSATFLAMELARQAGLPVILDVDYRPYSWRDAQEAASTCARAAHLSDIVIGNDVEFGVMANGDGLVYARSLARESKRVVYKMGEKGSITFGGGLSFAMDVDPVTPLKPTGAGDAFMGGFVTGLADGLDLALCVRRGTAAAAITVTRVGCAPALPTAAELQDFMANHPSPSTRPGD
jgi:5-dehydro-2-deoxygluconokinase